MGYASSDTRGQAHTFIYEHQDPRVHLHVDNSQGCFLRVLFVCAFRAQSDASSLWFPRWIYVGWTCVRRFSPVLSALFEPEEIDAHYSRPITRYLRVHPKDLDTSFSSSGFCFLFFYLGMIQRVQRWAVLPETETSSGLLLQANFHFYLHLLITERIKLRF